MAAYGETGPCSGQGKGAEVGIHLGLGVAVIGEEVLVIIFLLGALHIEVIGSFRRGHKSHTYADSVSRAMFQRREACAANDAPSCLRQTAWEGAQQGERGMSPL